MKSNVWDLISSKEQKSVYPRMTKCSVCSLLMKTVAVDPRFKHTKVLEDKHKICPFQEAGNWDDESSRGGLNCGLKMTYWEKEKIMFWRWWIWLRRDIISLPPTKPNILDRDCMIPWTGGGRGNPSSLGQSGVWSLIFQSLIIITLLKEVFVGLSHIYPSRKIILCPGPADAAD